MAILQYHQEQLQASTIPNRSALPSLQAGGISDTEVANELAVITNNAGNNPDHSDADTNIEICQACQKTAERDAVTGVKDGSTIIVKK